MVMRLFVVVGLAMLSALSASAQVAPPVLVVDTNPNAGDGIVSGGTGLSYPVDGTQPRTNVLTEFRGEIYFTATDATGDREMWRTNGTPEGTVQMIDLRSDGGSNPSGFIEYSGQLYFAATLDGNQRDTYVSDGHRVSRYRESTVPIRRLESAGALLLREDPGAIAIGLGNCLLDGSGGLLCSNGRMAVAQNIQVAEKDNLIFFREPVQGHLFRTFGPQVSEDSLSPQQLGRDFETRSAPYATSQRVYFVCNWVAEPRGVELCTNQGEPDQSGLVSDLRTGDASSNPLMMGVYGDRLYFRARRDDSLSRDVLHYTSASSTVVRIDNTAGTAPDFNVFPGVMFFELAGEVYYNGFTSSSGARIWRDGTEVVDLGPSGDIRNPLSDGERAFFRARASSGDPFQLYAFDGTTATPVADFPPEGGDFSHPTIYNGGLLYSDGNALYAYDVRPRAQRVNMSGAVPADGFRFEVYAGETLLPAWFSPVSGIADGELRVSRLSRQLESLPAPVPAFATLSGYYHLGVDDGLEALRGTLTLSYSEDELMEEGITNEAGLGVWQWSVDDQAWVAKPVLSRDLDANTLTLMDVSPTQFFAVGTDMPVGTEGRQPDSGVVLETPIPNPATGMTTLRYQLAEAGSIRLSVLDALGREVALVVDGVHRPGEHSARVPADALAPGIYVVRLQASGAVRSTRLTVVR